MVSDFLHRPPLLRLMVLRVTPSAIGAKASETAEHASEVNLETDPGLSFSIQTAISAELTSASFLKDCCPALDRYRPTTATHVMTGERQVCSNSGSLRLPISCYFANGSSLILNP